MSVQISLDRQFVGALETEMYSVLYTEGPLAEVSLYM